MKRSILLIISTLLALHCNATNIPLDSIKSKMVAFYKELDSWHIYQSLTVDDFPDFLIHDRKQGRIEEGKEGVFAFGLLASGERDHFVLLEKNSVEILNMWEPIDQNILKLSIFLERNKRYSKNDALFYIRDVIGTYQRDEKMLNRFKEKGYVL